MPTTHLIRRVAVLGAGVMGAQIAAHLVNLGVPVRLFDLPSDGAEPSRIAQQAIERLKQLKPAPLALPELAAHIAPANYAEHLPLLADCDLVIEAIAERLDWKQALYAQMGPWVAPGAIVASNTSGLSITALGEALPAALRPRFCGIHFFNPPRYMPLVELIPTPATEPAVLDALETFVTRCLGKGVVRARDTPNFIANRIGVAGMLSTMHHAQRLGLGFDVVDDVTGKKLGRASSGTFRTADVVGLDTLAHVVRTLQAQLPHDPLAAHFAVPAVVETLLSRGALGQKSGAGFYKKAGRAILQWDAASGDYIASGAKAEPFIDHILQRPAPERLRLLRESTHPQAQFLWAVLRDGFHDAALNLAAIADAARDVDLAMRWGFGMKQGPFELWQEAGWTTVAAWVAQDIAQGHTLCATPLPAWVFSGPVAEAGGVHTEGGSWSASRGAFVPRRVLPVYERHLFPERVRGEGGAQPLASGVEEFRNPAVRVWSLDGEVLIASITAKLHLISPDVTAGLLRAMEIAEARYQALVLWSPDEVFSAGANLEALMPVFMAQGAAGVEPVEKALQDLMMRLRYAQVPTVAAVRGLALGGGCELAVHCTQRVATLESYIGLVEVGVGLLPGAGGLTYLARRAAELAAAAPGVDGLHFLKNSFQAVAMATVSTSALEARRLGYLLPSDVIVPHRDELLFVALSQAKALAAASYRPPLPARFAVAGRDAAATLEASLVGMRDGGFITEHDRHIAHAIADVLCGGDVPAGTLVTEGYLLALERRHFCALIAHPKTHDRILGLLQTGKPLRN